MKAKYIALSAICALTLAACESRIELVPVSNEGKITAYIDNSDSKTIYYEDTKFSWVAEDAFYLIVTNATDGSLNHYTQWASESGSMVVFTGGTPSGEWEASGLAIYPTLDYSGSKGSGIAVDLPDKYAISGSNFMSIIPMIGQQDASDPFKYGFKTATGVLKVTLSNIPVEARQIVLTAAEGDVLCGRFPLDETSAKNGFEMSRAIEVTSGTAPAAVNTITIGIDQQNAGSTLSVYFPVPVGTVKAGATVSVQKSDGTPIMTTPATVRDITVTRNELLNITPKPVSVESWVSLGTGKYIDDHGFYYLSDGTSLSRTAADYIDVEIEQKSDEPNKFRVKNPYTTFASETFANPDEYLYVTVREDLGPGIVLNDSFHYSGNTLLMDNPYWGYDELYQNNRVIKYAADGVTPANIQLAQKYFAIAANSNCSRNPKIEIVFPGSEPMLADHLNYVYYAAAAYSAGKVAANVPETVTAIKVVAAENIADGIAALQAGTGPVLTFTESGSQSIQLSAGTYILVYVIENEGHGYTYDTSDAFTVKDGEVPIVAIAASNDAGTYDGTQGFDGDGPWALIDGKVDTYWHSSYVDGYDGWYSFKDLDPVYGIYIDLDLGESKTVTNFSILACLRAGAQEGFPKHVKVYGSTDYVAWGDVIGETADLKGGAAAGEWVDPLVCASATPIRYIRISIVSNSEDVNLCDVEGATRANYTHLAELAVVE